MEALNKIKRIFLPGKWEKDALLIAYKALHDILFVELLFFALAMFAEGVIPGIIISHIGFSKIVIAIALTMVVMSYLGNLPKIKELALTGEKKQTRKMVIAFVFFAALIMFNSQFKMNLILNLSLIAISLLIGYFIFQVLMEDEKSS
ncbi:MAG: hypothetical protein HGB08_02235 [Candidatus Moranbacteria bacterium]|nr:hypothetical protein [Candidatus Moranbacteria bacterium]